MSPPQQRSLLELLLPRGRAERALVLGSACPERLRPAAGDAAEGLLDLVLLTPGDSERGRRWLDSAVGECASRIGPDGIVYLILPRRSRRRARRRLAAQGLVVEGAVLHRPDVASTRELVPLEREAFRRAGGYGRWRRALAGVLFRLGGGAALRVSLADIALVARRPGARRQLEWLEQAGTAAGHARSAVISSSWRPDAASVVLHPLTERGVAPVVAKLRLAGAARGTGEAERLDRLGPAARAAGAVVPEPVARLDLDGVPVLVETRVEGEIEATRLMRRPARLEGVLAGVAGWLERWGAATARQHPLSPEHLERELLEPAEAVAPLLSSGGAEYLTALRERCNRLVGTRVKLVASHNDLTMWNVLVDAEGAVGIVDWEAAEEASLPLKDLFYAAVDAVAATNRYRDRPAAARDCLAPGGRLSGLLAGRQARIEAAVPVGPELSALCLHACWLGHARNEHRAALPSDDRPFLQIMEWLAATLPP